MGTSVPAHATSGSGDGVTPRSPLPTDRPDPGRRSNDRQRGKDRTVPTCHSASRGRALTLCVVKSFTQSGAMGGEPGVEFGRAPLFGSWRRTGPAAGSARRYTHRQRSMKRWAIWGAILAAGLGLGAARPALGQTAQPQVIVVSLTGTVDPLSARYVERGLRTGVNEKAAAVLIRIDTPGGLDSSMRSIITAISTTTSVPVVCWAGPSCA